MSALQTGQRELPTAADVIFCMHAEQTQWPQGTMDGVIVAHLTVRRCVARRIIRHGGDLQGGVICRQCNAKAVNLASGEVRCGEIGAVISSAETSEAVKCSDPMWSSVVNEVQQSVLSTTCDGRTGLIILWCHEKLEQETAVMQQMWGLGFKVTLCGWKNTTEFLR